MSSPIGHHVICRLTDSRVIAPAVEQRRLVARTIVEKTRGQPLLCFNVPDNHLHLELGTADPGACSEIARQIEIALTHRLRLPVGFSRVKLIPILHQQHLTRAFDYVLRQQPHHGLRCDPYHEASNLPDLLGLRLVAGCTANTVRQLLPRVDRRLLLGLLDVDELSEASGPENLVLPAACAAGGVSDLRGRKPEVRALWRAVLALLEGQLAPGEIAARLGISRQTLHRIRGTAPDPRAVRATRLQLGLRQVLADRPTGAFVDR